MTESPNILLLAGSPQAERLVQSMPTGSAAAEADPFAALERLADRAYGAVLVTSPRPGLAKLLKAVRRLQPDASIFGLCGPAGEHDLRLACAEDAQVLDDYFIIPPTAGEWGRILRAAGGDAVGEGSRAVEGGLSSRELTQLIESASSPNDLADCVARLGRQACGTELRWSRQGQPRAGIQQLLTMDDDPLRILWSVAPLTPDEHSSQWLSALRAVLPALACGARRTAALGRMAITDHLTGAYNRRYFMHFAERMLVAARKKRRRATLLLYDIDNFKHYNDQFGHTAGDHILRETAGLMNQVTRKHDLVARLGGDEFVMLFLDFGPARLPGSKPPETAFALCDRFRQAVSSHVFKFLGPKATGTLTISGGLASFPWDGLTVADLLATADGALRQAKAGGKNNIFLVGGLVDRPNE